jgi:hypothetical protein
MNRRSRPGRYDPPVRAFAGRLQDPHRVNLRKASRAAIVVPAVLALLMSTGNEPSALLSAFGSFAALVFADYGARHRRRALLLVEALVDHADQPDALRDAIGLVWVHEWLVVVDGHVLVERAPG